jgi:hypothetical protein
LLALTYQNILDLNVACRAKRTQTYWHVRKFKCPLKKTQPSCPCSRDLNWTGKGLRKSHTVSDHLVTPSVHHTHIWYWIYTLWPLTYRVYWKEYAILHTNVPQLKLNLYNQRHLCAFLVAKVTKSVHLAWSCFLWSVRTNPLLCNYFCEHTDNRSIRHLHKIVSVPQITVLWNFIGKVCILSCPSSIYVNL